MKKSIAGRQRGFTLLELMLTIGIAALIMGLAVPSFTNLVRNSRMTQAANDVVVALNLARSESIKRRTAVTFCTASDLDATPTCDEDATGLLGWVVFVDNDRNGQWDPDSTFNDIDDDGHKDVAEVDGTDPDSVWTAEQVDEDIDLDGRQDVAEADLPEQVLAVHPPLLDTIFSRGAFDPLRITYLDTGVADGNASGAIVLCDSRGNVAAGGELSSARAIVLSPTGRASVTRAPDEIADQLTRIATVTGDDSAIGGCEP